MLQGDYPAYRKDFFVVFFKHQVLYARAALVAANIMRALSRVFFSVRLSLYDLPLKKNQNQ